MIDEKRLEEMKNDFYSHDSNEDCLSCEDCPDLFETLSAALKVVRAAQCIEVGSGHYYEECSDEHCNRCCRELREALAPFEEKEITGKCCDNGNFEETHDCQKKDGTK